MAAAGTTVIVNETAQVLHMKVANHRYFVDFTTLDKGEKYSMTVDYNATYQEFLMGVDTKGKRLIVSSDDCCDYQCIVIKESVDGEFDVEKEPRRQLSSDAVETPTVVKKSKLSWRFWL